MELERIGGKRRKTYQMCDAIRVEINRIDNTATVSQLRASITFAVIRVRNVQYEIANRNSNTTDVAFRILKKEHTHTDTSIV